MRRDEPIDKLFEAAHLNEAVSQQLHRPQAYSVMQKYTLESYLPNLVTIWRGETGKRDWLLIGVKPKAGRKILYLPVRLESCYPDECTVHAVLPETTHSHVGSSLIFLCGACLGGS